MLFILHIYQYIQYIAIHGKARQYVQPKLFRFQTADPLKSGCFDGLCRNQNMSSTGMQLEVSAWRPQAKCDNTWLQICPCEAALFLSSLVTIVRNRHVLTQNSTGKAANTSTSNCSFVKTLLPLYLPLRYRHFVGTCQCKFSFREVF